MTISSEDDPTISEQISLPLTSGTFQRTSSGATTCYMELTYEFNASSKVYSTFEGDVLYNPLIE
jgi:hypothetical protein